jgi:SAM-dependent methyltransferase
MGASSQHFRQLQRVFESHGIRSDAQIAEHVAFLLLCQDRWNAIIHLRVEELQSGLDTIYQELVQSYEELTIPRPVPTAQWGRDSLGELISLVDQAKRNSPFGQNEGRFFQREVRAELLKDTGGPQYPTPHHIADLIAALTIDLAELEGRENIQILDPTAGSGGLLAAIYALCPQACLKGYDFDPLWASLGSANLILHGANVTYTTGSVLDYYNQCRENFDYAVMNPPFGGVRNIGEVASTVSVEYGRSNATVLAALVGQSLRPGGRASFLTPGGVLFGGGGEANLRHWLASQKLEAVITLPKGAFLPYSHIETHLVVFQKNDQGGMEQPENRAWFCKATRDGYDESVGRDLTGEPTSDENELPRIQALIRLTRRGVWQQVFNVSEIGSFEIAGLQPPDGLDGIAVRVTGNAQNVRWECVPAEQLLFKLSNQQHELIGWGIASDENAQTIAFTATQANSVNWNTLIPAQGQLAEIPQSWQLGDEDATLSISQQDLLSITLRKDNTSYQFRSGVEQTIKVCLISSNNHITTGWLSLAQAEDVQKIQKDEFGQKFGAIPIISNTELRVGWMINLTHGEDQNGERITKFAHLIICFDPQINVFSNNEGDFSYVLLQHGWMKIRQRGPVTLRIVTGEPINFKSNQRMLGFAIGRDPIAQGKQKIIGVLLPINEYDPDHNGQRSFLPETFLPEGEVISLGNPRELLANIRKKQTEMAGRLNSLSKILGGKLVLAENANYQAEPPTWMIEMLSEEQRQFWQLLKSKVDRQRSKHFSVEEVNVWCRAEGALKLTEDQILQQLELFQRLGLVVEVHNFGMNYYRCINQSELIQS